MLAIAAVMVPAQELAPNRHRLIFHGSVRDIDEVHLFPSFREVQVRTPHCSFIYSYDQLVDVLRDEETTCDADSYALTENVTDSTSVDNGGIMGQLELFV